MHGRGKLAGVCLNPGTPVTALEAILPELDQVMVMAVNPGWSGQSSSRGRCRRCGACAR